MAVNTQAGNIAALLALGFGVFFVAQHATKCEDPLQKLFFPSGVPGGCITPTTKGGNQAVSSSSNTGSAPGGSQSSGNQVVGSTPANGACGSTGQIYPNLNQAQNLYVQHGGPASFDANNFVAACSTGYVVIVGGHWL